MFVSQKNTIGWILLTVEKTMPHKFQQKQLEHSPQIHHPQYPRKYGCMYPDC